MISPVVLSQCEHVAASDADDEAEFLSKYNYLSAVNIEEQTTK